MPTQSRYQCVATLHGRTNRVRRRRPVKQSVRAIRGAGPVRRRPAERPRRVRIGRQHAHGVGHVDRPVPPDAARAHARRAAPASSRTARRSLVDAATGAGQLRRCPAARPRRVRIGRQHAHGVGPVERLVPPDAAGSRGLCAAPASRRTARRSLIDAATGAGLVRRRPPERPRRVRLVGQHAQGVGRVERSARPDATRAHWLRAAPASSRTARLMLVDAVTGALRRRPVERQRRVRIVRQLAQGVGRVDR